MQKITLIGNLGKDAEEKFTKNGIRFITFSLAVSPRKNETVWYECSIWNKKLDQLEKLVPYLNKGTRVFIFGDLQTPDFYQRKDGCPAIKLRVEPDVINFVGGQSRQPSEEKEQHFESNLFTPKDAAATQDDLPF